jgi:hypothetical protein
MSAQLYNPKAKKLVNVGASQIKALKKAGWLSPSEVPKEAPKVVAPKESLKKGSKPSLSK